jgi:hypothetical protein
LVDKSADAEGQACSIIATIAGHRLLCSAEPLSPGRFRAKIRMSDEVYKQLVEKSGDKALTSDSRMSLEIVCGKRRLVRETSFIFRGE